MNGYAHYWREHPRQAGRYVLMRQTPQQAWKYDVRWYGKTTALRSWQDWHEALLLWSRCIMEGDAPLLPDAPMDDGEWN